MSNRREFLTQAIAAGGMLLSGPAYSRAQDRLASIAAKSLRVLILGGTGFIGPHHVRAAVARGHKVAVFNRGKSHAELPKGVERLVGDRNGNLTAILNRDWDAVVDLATSSPGWVRSVGEALRQNVKHYTFISTGAVYAYLPVSHTPYSEEHPTVNYPGDADADPIKPPTTLQEYGGLKRLCEREAERQFAERTLIIRPGYITGPGDPQDHLIYWPLRLEQGGDVMVAGDPSVPAQFVDVRDMARWSIRMIEQRATGIYNMVDRPLSLSNLVQIAREVIRTESIPSEPKLTWVPWSWLDAQPDKDLWQRVLFWPFDSDGSAGRMNMSFDRALVQGLTPRPVSVTMADTLAWYREQSLARRAQTLTRTKPKEDGSGMERMPIAWPTYLAREKQVLAAWRAEPPPKHTDHAAG